MASIYTAESTEVLIQRLNLVTALKEIELLAALPKPYFRYLYLKPLLRLIAYLQRFPDLDDSSELGYFVPVIEYKLDAMIRGMKQHEAYTSVASEEQHTSTKDVARYRLFFSLFMYGVGPLLTGRRVWLIDDKKKLWNPYLHPPLTSSTRYQVDSVDIWNNHSTAAFIHRFFETTALRWLYAAMPSNIDIHQVIAYPERSSTLGSILCTVYDISQLPVPVPVPVSNISEASPVTLSQQSDIRDEEGMQFIAWLTEAINDGAIKVDQRGSMVYRYEGNLALVSPTIFMHYSKHVAKDWKRIQKSVLKLKQHRLNYQVNPPDLCHPLDRFGKQFNCMLIPEVASRETRRIKDFADIEKFFEWVESKFKGNRQVKDDKGRLLSFRYKDGTAYVYPDIFVNFKQGDKKQGENFFNLIQQLAIHEKNDQADLFSLNTGDSRIQYLLIKNQEKESYLHKGT